MSGVLAILNGGGSGSLKATLNRNFLAGNRFGTSGSAITSQSVTATVIGGRPPYTGAWIYVSGSTGVFNTSPSPTTYFTAYFTSSGSKSAVYVYRVTDANAVVVDSAPLSINLGVDPYGS